MTGVWLEAVSTRGKGLIDGSACRASSASKGLDCASDAGVGGATYRRGCSTERDPTCETQVQKSIRGDVYCAC